MDIRYCRPAGLARLATSSYIVKYIFLTGNNNNNDNIDELLAFVYVKMSSTMIHVYPNTLHVLMMVRHLKIICCDA